jgi:hypothetical protein
MTGGKDRGVAAMSMRWTVCATLTALLCLCVADGSAVEPEDCKARPTAFQTIQKGIEATSEETTAQTIWNVLSKVT